MRKILAAIVAIVVFWGVSVNYGELYAVFYDRFSNEKQSQVSEMDFELMGNSMDQQFINAEGGLTLDKNNEASVDINFDVKNTGTCDMYIRVAILPVILDKQNPQIVYKLNKSSCEIQYCNENDSSVLDEKYWEKSSDGYYYYKKVLKQGQSLDNGLMSKIKFKPSKSEIVDFSDKQVQIAVSVESRQNEFNDVVGN